MDTLGSVTSLSSINSSHYIDIPPTASPDITFAFVEFDPPEADCSGKGVYQMSPALWRLLFSAKHVASLSLTASIVRPIPNANFKDSDVFAMDMNSGDASTSTGEMVMMTPYLHFTGGDILYFKSLQPTSHGAIAGACLVLVVLAILERMLSAARGIMQDHWRRSTLSLIAGRSSEYVDDTTRSDDGEKKDANVEEQVLANSPAASSTPKGRITSRRARIIAPFVASHDITRGVLYSLQALLAYALMLAVMTFQAAYVISIVLGLGLGEVLFGRFGTGSFQLH
ncbi:hypothetical protein EVG20_g375 [Dentipellis fragilis]|uniref:Copper transport protein n=1 Tax=Dentipellis fragilis TaxID=205917 RepID=A0A4Y9ZDX0_9AGAM|nr:hypothetical protein EVG20_g375 [Dentipellis fragilis]